MPVIGISTVAWLPDGARLINHKAIQNMPSVKASRRGSITALLDGGSYIYDSGLTWSDSPMTITLFLDRDLQQWLKMIIQTSPEVVVSLDQGCFQAKLRSLSLSGSGMSLELTITEELG